jgi:phenylalanyl-tRNA synthetase beta chain
MKVSLAWLQNYFEEPLPEVSEIVDSLTFHSSEIEEVIGEGDATVLDVKVLPDRAPYALSHRGIAYELGAALNRPLLVDPLRAELPAYSGDARVKVEINDPLCTRYIAARVTGVSVGPSPEWLKTSLERIGQRSINNVVDATNYVMLNIGQPLHAFDAAKIEEKEGVAYITVRTAEEEEKITTLTGEEFALPEATLVIADGVSGAALGIAGVKGGKAAEITTATTDIIIESANFDGTRTRKTSQALKLWTDASLRFQNKLSPELAAYGMRDVIALILDIAGGTLEGVTDVYPNPEPANASVTCTVAQINGLLGTAFTAEDVTGAFDRLSLTYVQEGDAITVSPSFERRDIVIWQDLAEEVGRILGYEILQPIVLPAMTNPVDQEKYNGIERIKDLLVEHGFIEISTQSFATEGEVKLANPLQQERPWLRASLMTNMSETLSRAASVAPRVLGPESSVKLFEIGSVFNSEGEYFSLALGYRQLTGKQTFAPVREILDALYTAFPGSDIPNILFSNVEVVEIPLQVVNLETIGKEYTPTRIELGPFTPFSIYPFALRDVAVWTPEGTEATEVSMILEQCAGDLLARIDLFDRFEKEGRTSYAFRLVFQSNEKTLSDTDIDPIMTRITEALNAKEEWDVR